MLTRRQFLESSGAVAAAAAAPAADARAEGITALPNYRALVCIALGGGADSYNMLVPTDALAFRNYAKRRGSLALQRHELLPLRGTDLAARSYALHRGMHEVHELFGSGDVALLANTGPLLGPFRRPQGIRLPDLSHKGLIACWHNGASARRLHSGWAGRAADVLADQHGQGPMPINVSMAGRSVLQLGRYSAAVDLCASPYQRSYQLSPAGSAGVDFSYVNRQLAERAIAAGRPRLVRRRTRLRHTVETESASLIKAAISDLPEFHTTFAQDAFSVDLERVARVIAARRQLNVRRQIFFVHFDGWDHHHALLENQAVLLPMLSRGLAAFRDALKEQGAYDDVTTFTISEFGRSLESNGSGSDHGWGGHHIVMGGAVQGGKIYGNYPDLTAGSPLDIGAGSFIPTTSMQEYLAEMLLWFGIPIAELSYVLPDIAKFWSAQARSFPLNMLR